MILDVYKIIGNLHQGPMPPAGDIVAQGGFDVLVLCAWENQDAAAYPGVEVIQAPGEDIDESPVDPQELEQWKAAATTVAARLKAGKRVLVTCMGGYNRSGMVTALAMGEVTSWQPIDIVDHIRSRRPGALHNKSFVRWLIQNLPKRDDDQQEPDSQ